MESKCCMFKGILHTCKDGGDLINPTQQNLETFKAKSKERKDGKFSSNDLPATQTMWMHKNCSKTYISKDHIKRHLARLRKAEDTEISSHPRKSARIGNVKSFDFECNCLFCGAECHIVNPDKKNPQRWERNKGVLCRTADRGKSIDGIRRLSFREVIIQVSKISFLNIYVYIIAFYGTACCLVLFMISISKY